MFEFRLSIQFFSRLSLAVLLGLAGVFFSPTQTFASIGTHLGVGDPGHQMAIMDIVGSKNGREEGFPVTIMVDAGTGNDTIQQLAEKAKSNNFFPIVRINYACANDRNPVATAQAAHQIFGAIFGGDFVLTFGNEVNNQDSDQVGCTNWSAYTNNYRTIKVLGNNISPSTLDWYMGVSEYNAQKFLDDSGLSGDYKTARLRTANAYGCVGETNESCDIGSGGQTWQTGVQGINQDLYLTEFSLSPGGDNPPDLDLAKVVQFIEEVGPQTGAKQITPLVRNVCENLINEGEWLIYVHGNLYTSMGTQVDIDSCVATVGSGKTYTPRDRNEYFLYPLNMNPDTDWNQGADTLDDRTNELIWNMVYDQGYQVSCPNKQIQLQKKVIDAIDRYFNLYGFAHPPALEMGSSATLRANATDAKIPLFRGNEDPTETQKTTSFEGYFGSLLLGETNPMIGAGVANSLSSKEEQCRFKHDNAMVINELCQKLQNPTECALDKPIQGTDITPSGLFWKMDEYLHEQVANSTDKTSTHINCEDWVMDWESFQEKRPTAAQGIGQKEFEVVQEALNNMPIIPDLSYRMAYLVITPLQYPKDDGDAFWFYANNEEPVAQHAPIFIGIKIPDTTTNRAYSASFADAAQISSNALKENTDIVEEYNMEKGRREGLLSNITNAQNIRINNIGQIPEAQTKQVINCTSLERCQTGDEENPLYLKEALIDIINGEGNSCGGGGGLVEDAGDIFSYADATSDTSRDFSEPFLNGYLSQTGNQDFEWGLKINSAGDARAPFSNPFSGESNSVPVMIHLVAPVGSNLQDIQKGFWSFLTTNTQELIRAEAPDYYPLKDLSFGFNDQDKHGFWDPAKDCGELTDEFGNVTPIEGCTNNDFTIKLTDEDNDENPQYPGAKLGWLIKKMQESFNAVGSAAYNYVVSCATTEDMFLGRCAGNAGAGDAGSGANRAPLSQEDVDAIKNGEFRGGWGPTRCAPITDPNNPCDVNGEIMKQNFPNENQRWNASVICHAESGGDPGKTNKGCVNGSSLDYSIGLFQVNLVISNRCPGGISDFSYNPISCTIEDQGALDLCEANLKNPIKNIEWAANNSGHGKYWDAWSTSKPEYCGNYLIY